MTYNEFYLKEYKEKLAEFIQESEKFRNYLPPPEISQYDELVEWFKITENRLMSKNQYALLRQKFLDLCEAYNNLTKKSDSV